MPRPAIALFAAAATTIAATANAQSFVNWEHPHVHPVDMTPGETLLLAVNTPDNRLEIFTIAPDGTPIWAASVPVGLDPVSVRARSDTEAWVVNHASDSVSVVHLPSARVVRTIDTADEPADVAFAGNPGLGIPEKALVSVSQENQLWILDPSDPDAPPQIIDIQGEDPRALAVSDDGATAFLAIFESGNDTTILGGGFTSPAAFPPNVVSDLDGPYLGQNPPPNSGSIFLPEIAAPNPPAVGLIVRKNALGEWRDDNGLDWTPKVSGVNAADSGRQPGWNLLDHDVAVIDLASSSVSYITGLMNICMAIDYNPAAQKISVVGTDATNEIRFEPILNARFLRVNVALTDAAGASKTIADLNPHLSYTNDIPFVPIPQNQRDRSLGDPRAIAWRADGSLAYVAGMGSNNLTIIDASGARAPGAADTIEVGRGPTGIAISESRNLAYVINKFDATISTIDLAAETQTHTTPFFDPTPQAIVDGREHLYDTHETSGLGHTSCASCHVDARTDRLAWDLGGPDGAVKPFEGNCPDLGCQDWHPMKGPMLTQTLQDIIGKEPFHWRADRTGLEEFNGAFESILGDTGDLLTPQEMQEFEDFLASIHFPPNPFRNLDNTLPEDLPLDGHFTTGRFAPAGQPLPNGDATTGLLLYRTGLLDGGLECVTCHALPTGLGPDTRIVGLGLEFIPPGPMGEHHLALVSSDGSTNATIKIPHLRNLYERTGFNLTQINNTAGFGYLHDGSVDSIERFLTEPAFSLASVQELADMVAFMLAFSGSDLPEGSLTDLFEPPGVPSLDTHAAVGTQLTVADPQALSPAQSLLLDDMLALANSGAVGLVVKGHRNGEARGYTYLGGGIFQSDRNAEAIGAQTLRDAAAPGDELTWTVVPAGSQTRIGIDRDEDSHLDRDEIDAGADPADPASVPSPALCRADLDNDGDTDVFDFNVFAPAFGTTLGDPGFVPAADLDANNTVNVFDFNIFGPDFGCEN